jgi:Tfp pilus assembly protein PilP
VKQRVAELIVMVSAGLGIWPGLAIAQGAPATPPTQGATPAAASTTATAQPAAAQPASEPYTFNPEGRRDPFVSLIGRGGMQTDPGARAEGLAGLTTAEVIVKGTFQSHGGYLALVQAPDGKTLRARVNDKLADGTIRSITASGMVIMQEVNDPLSLVKVKEVRKGLRASDDVKP